MRAAGALLCHDAERDRALSDPIEIQKKRKEDYIRIEPHTNYGRPGPLAHKIFVAFIKKHSDYGRPVQSDVSFTKRELMRLVGRKEWGGKDSEELSRALYEIRRTAITAFFNTDDRYIERDFNISTSSILSGAIPIPIRSSYAGLRSPNRLSNRSATRTLPASITS